MMIPEPMLRVLRAEGRAVWVVRDFDALLKTFPEALFLGVTGERVGNRVVVSPVAELPPWIRHRGREIADRIHTPPANADEEWIKRNTLFLDKPGAK